MKDTLQVFKSVIMDPVPVVNTGVILGLSTMQWDLLIKILVAVPSVIWTWFRVANEIKNYKASKNGEKNS